MIGQVQRRFPAAGMTCVVLTLVVSACAGSRDVERPPDDRFGHRFEEEGPEGRRTIAILPPDSAVTYFYYPVVVDTVHIRPATFELGSVGGGDVPVEVLVKGSLPDGCTELHDVSQERFGHIIHMDVRMRRPQGAVCTRVNRPYRFYVRLEGLYEEGHYTLKLNERVFTFSVRLPAG